MAVDLFGDRRELIEVLGSADEQVKYAFFALSSRYEAFAEGLEAEGLRAGIVGVPVILPSVDGDEENLDVATDPGTLMGNGVWTDVGRDITIALVAFRQSGDLA